MYTIVIPTLQSSQLERVLVALQNQTYFDQIDEIIVVGQQDDIRWSRYHKTKYVPQNINPTPAHNRNIGVKLAKSEWICFIDSDCIPQTDWLEQFSKHRTNDGFVYAGSVEIPPKTGYWPTCDHYFAFEPQANGIVKDGEIKNAATLNFMISRTIFLLHGGFDEGFIEAAGEDTDLCWRLRSNGNNILMIKDACVLHEHKRNKFHRIWNHCFRFGFNQTHVWRKNDLFLLLGLIGLPFVGEIGVTIRLLFRFIVRPIRNPRYLFFIKYLPGIFVLDIAHSLGIIYGTRHNKG